LLAGVCAFVDVAARPTAKRPNLAFLCPVSAFNPVDGAVIHPKDKTASYRPKTANEDNGTWRGVDLSGS